MAWFYSKFRSNSEIRVSESNTSISTYYIRNSNFILKKKTIYPKLPEKKKNLFSTSQVYVTSGEGHHMIIYYLSSPTIPIPQKKTCPT